MRRLQRDGHGDDAGFGLVEAIVSLLIAGIVFGALATSLVAAVQASLYGRQNQQATDFMTREIERLRSLDFGSLAHATAPTGGPLVPCGGTVCLLVDGVPEPVVVEAGGAVVNSQVLTGAETNATEYTVTSFVTQAVGEPTDQVRRATVVATWMNRGLERSRTVSTLVALSQRGLPLPVFRLEVIDSPRTVNPGATVTYELIVTNQGAPDRFNLTSTGTGAWSWYEDTDGDGHFNPVPGGSDQPLSDSSPLDGQPDTGRMDPSTTFRFFITRTLDPSEPVGTKVATVWATSVGQPAAASGQRSVDVTTIVTTGPVTPPPPTGPPPTAEVTCAAPTTATLPTAPGGYTNRQYTLQHEGIGDSPLQPQMYLGSGTPDEPALGHYSTDSDPAATGRVLDAVPSINSSYSSVLSNSNPEKYADWALQFAKKGDIAGPSVARFWVNAGGGPATVKVILYRATTSGSGLSRTFLAEKVVAVPACAGFQELYVELDPISATAIAKNGWIGLRVVLVADAGTARLAYDEPYQFPAAFSVAVKGGF